MVAKTTWTPEEDELLRKLYPTSKIEDLMPVLNHSRYGIISRVRDLKIRKDPEWKRQQLMRTSFKKGHVPTIKGKTWDEAGIPKESQEKMRSTCFKKGSKSPTARPVGYERKNSCGYWMVKTPEGVFRQKQRVLWEQHYGPIPENVVITFKDGNKDNVTIENLRAENVVDKFMRCGHCDSLYPPEMRKLFYLKGALRRQIKQAEKKEDGHKRRNKPTGKDEG